MSFLMTFCTLVVRVFCFPLHLLDAVGLYKHYKRIVPLLLFRITKLYNKKMYERKKELFACLSDFKQSGQNLTILEIGCGTGSNFHFYPSGCKVICTDNNVHFEKYLRRNMRENPHVAYEKFMETSAEDMRSFEDSCVDVVVCTLVLCSVDNVPKTLKEVQRVLRPGGAFFFLEHVAAEPSSWTYFFQSILKPLCYYIGDGCEVTRATWTHLEAAGFSDLKLRHIKAPLIFFNKPHIMGYGVK
ncbi:N6-adenosine-methyltransferase TMT1A-like [Corythoichthys intestinalis]|uniref:N6-adenosine-methyltransferase TMT1A-like n=1 Tax=Corythoichthys intestinalis TaxID=161448 RepID=UPI0025A559DA|nr:N6-adenosine-methyltransferase TMT1A-like [Corythoichthys intestinalis]